MKAKKKFKFFILLAFILSLILTFFFTYLTRSDSNQKNIYKITFKNLCKQKNLKLVLNKIDEEWLNDYFKVYNSNYNCRNEKIPHIFKLLISKKKQTNLEIINEQFILGHSKGEFRKYFKFKAQKRSNADKIFGYNYNDYNQIYSFKNFVSIAIEKQNKGKIIENEIYPILIFFLCSIFFINIVIMICCMKIYETLYNILKPLKQP